MRLALLSLSLSVQPVKSAKKTAKAARKQTAKQAAKQVEAVKEAVAQVAAEPAAVAPEQVRWGESAWPSRLRHLVAAVHHSTWHSCCKPSQLYPAFPPRCVSSPAVPPLHTHAHNPPAAQQDPGLQAQGSQGRQGRQHRQEEQQQEASGGGQDAKGACWVGPGGLRLVLRMDGIAWVSKPSKPS